MSKPWAEHSYSLDEFPFPDHVAGTLGFAVTSELTRLAALLSRRTWRTDQQSPWHGDFYSGFAAWRSVFDTFVRDVIARLVDEPFYYQAVPTFRVHLPGNVAVGEFHTDAQYNHPDGETSWWVPLTAACLTSSVWIEADPEQFAAALSAGEKCRVDDDGAYLAPCVGPGQMIGFDAVHRRHGNEINCTGRSRVSFDFRTLPVRLLPAVEGGTTEHTKMRFIPGGYYASEAITP